MTDEQIEIIKALHTRVLMYSGGKSVEFISDLHIQSFQSPDKLLTEGQTKWLYSLLHRYRKQIPGLHERCCVDPLCRYARKWEAVKNVSQLRLELDFG